MYEDFMSSQLLLDLHFFPPLSILPKMISISFKQNGIN